MRSETQTKTKFWQTHWGKNLITVILFIAVFLALRPFMQGDVIEGQAPTLKLTTLDGTPLDLQALNAQGEPVLIHIWATWCPVCTFSRDGIENIAADHKVISIATQSGDDEQLLEYAKTHQMDTSIIVNDLDGQIAKLFGAKGVPADFVIAPNGNIEFVEVGVTSAIGLRLRLWWSGLNAGDAP
ncbi:protein disulfide oxidoreductase [Thiosulfatimonas sediminis]|uniref:Protein disulfide oxidoreductase n=1 Tax=Thiosulfatimonas sediminis TaxID=2675054 RepID=A0A6F8PSR4_9GAMM|nr:protein disulfide oxidoreductase [Thiosulfatimonas sediminis]BBP45173.1 protein disulfide oxidoreductase [Thiosulfatimonas sediminis]